MHTGMCHVIRPRTMRPIQYDISHTVKRWALHNSGLAFKISAAHSAPEATSECPVLDTMNWLLHSFWMWSSCLKTRRGCDHSYLKESEAGIVNTGFETRFLKEEESLEGNDSGLFQRNFPRALIVGSTGEDCGGLYILCWLLSWQNVNGPSCHQATFH